MIDQNDYDMEQWLQHHNRVTILHEGDTWRNVHLSYVPDDSGPGPYDKHPSFFCWGNPDRGTFHSFFSKHATVIKDDAEKVIRVSLLDYEFV
jgi:hypothetical protein